MKKTHYQALWVTCQVFLFFLPILILVWFVPYDISYDQMYIEQVNTRALEEGYGQGNELTDFSEAIIAQYDAEGKYMKKEWRLNHTELYYVVAILVGVLIGIALQVFNFAWMMIYSDLYD